MSMISDSPDSMIKSFCFTSTSINNPLDYHRRQYIEVNGYFKCVAGRQSFLKYNQWESKVFHLIP